jgi:hypothetical protein
MQRLIINNKSIEYNKYLTQKELSLFSLSLKDKLTLFLLGHIYIGRYKPEGFTAPVNFYVVKYKDKYFISYRQGFTEAFYYPEVLK